MPNLPPYGRMVGSVERGDRPIEPSLDSSDLAAGDVVKNLDCLQHFDNIYWTVIFLPLYTLTWSILYLCRDSEVTRWFIVCFVC